MGFWITILALARRKLLSIPLLGCAIAVALAGYFLTPLQYFSSTTMVLVTPAVGRTLTQDPTVPIDLTNPMLSFSNDLKTASTILIWAMNAPAVADELGADDDGPTKLTINDGRTDPTLIDGNGPFIYIAVESTSRADAKDVVVRAQERMRRELLNRQESLGAPPETYLTIVDVVSPPTSPKVIRAGKIKTGCIGFVMSLLLGLTAAYAWQASRHRGAAAGPSRHDDKGLELGRDNNDLDVVAEDWFDTTRARADTELAYNVQREKEPESPEMVKPQTPGEELVDDDRHEVDRSRKRPSELDQSTVPQQLVYHSDEEEPAGEWEIYIADTLPDYQGSAPNSARELDWTANWDLSDFQSERRSVVTTNGDSGIAGNERSLTRSMGGLKPESVPSVRASADRNAKEAGFGAAYRSSEILEDNGQTRNVDLLDGEHAAAAERSTADNEKAGATPPESERAVHPWQEATRVKDWDLYILEYPPEDEAPAHRSEHAEFDASSDWGLDGSASEHGSVLGTNGGTDAVRKHQRMA